MFGGIWQYWTTSPLVALFHSTWAVPPELMAASGRAQDPRSKAVPGWAAKERQHGERDAAGQNRE